MNEIITLLNVSNLSHKTWWWFQDILIWLLMTKCITLFWTEINRIHSHDNFLSYYEYVLLSVLEFYAFSTFGIV